ncbi:MAG: HepT-like ribonuclease domain-containing protein [Dysgonamonadaceae bacterium]
MQRDPRAYLWDVREAADAILGFVAGVTFDAYAANPLLHSAVERKFEIIGEALNQFSKADPALAARIPDLPRIVA